MAGFFVQILGFIIILLMAYTGMYTSDKWFILCVPGVLIYAGYGILNVIMTVFLSDTVDYGEIKNRTRDESVIFSMQTFTVKLASGIAVLIAGFVVKWINLDTSDGAINATNVLQGLRLWMTIPSVVLLIIGIILYRFFYKLDDKKMDEIRKKLHK